MKVLLIRPPVRNLLHGVALPDFVVEEQGTYPPLGLMYIASYLREKSGHDVRIIDAEIENLSYEGLEKKIRKMNPDVVGINTLTLNLIDVRETARLVKKIDNNIKTVVGGRHVDIYPYETISFPEIDFAIIGEGEISFTKLVNTLDKECDYEKIPGLFFKRKKKIVSTGQPEIHKNLDILPFPARDLTPYKKYRSLLSKKSLFTTMITSKGCPYNCLFCDKPYGKSVRTRSAENVVDEIEECANLGLNEILIFDDTFTIDKQRVLNICKKIKQRNIDIDFAIRTRVDLINKKLLSELKSAGCSRVQYGIESGVQKNLNKIRKGITIKQIKDAVNAAKSEKLIVYGDFMLGFPGETESEMLETIEFAKKLDLDFAQFSITTPYPGTELYNNGVKEGIFEDYWRKFAKNPKPDFEIKYLEGPVPSRTVFRLLNYAYKSFYFSRPKYILKRLFNFRSLKEFNRHFLAGLKILTER
jgi:radical SAM superfamily enzyme YgiQ (UPF0313 family)